MGKKHCGKCGKTRNVSSFSLRTDRPGKRQSQCKDCSRTRWKSYYAIPNNRDRANKRNRESRQAFRLANPLAERKRVRTYQQKIRRETIIAYGGRCSCCGETQYEFLAVDHKKNNGSQHRREIGLTGGFSFYLWLRRQGYPKKDFQLLCHNCNLAKSFYGTCPHAQGKTTRERTKI